MFSIFKRPKKKIGIAFGGGGSRGVAHLGIIQVLQEENVNISFVSGTSIGALVGAFFADKRPIDEMIEIVDSLGYKDFMSLDLNLQGFSSSERTVGKLVKKYIKHDSFSGLGIPFSVVAADICNGVPVVLDEGKLSKSVSMSANFPMVFSPIKHDENYYVDGGLFVNVPAKQVRDLGADIVIGIDLNPNTKFSCNRKSALDMANRSIDLLIDGQNPAQHADLLVRPLKEFVSFYNMKNKKKLIEMGREAAYKEIIPFLIKKKLI